MLISVYMYKSKQWVKVEFLQLVSFTSILTMIHLHLYLLLPSHHNIPWSSYIHSSFSSFRSSVPKKRRSWLSRRGPRRRGSFAKRPRGSNASRRRRGRGWRRPRRRGRPWWRAPAWVHLFIHIYYTYYFIHSFIRLATIWFIAVFLSYVSVFLLLILTFFLFSTYIRSFLQYCFFLPFLSL